MSSTSLPSSGRQEQPGVEFSRFAAVPLAAAARARTLPLDAYAGLLRCLMVVYEALELAAKGSARGTSAPADELLLLQNDLDFIAGRARAPIVEAELHAELLAERIRLWGEHSPQALQGAFAVLGGPAITLAAPPQAIAQCFDFKRGSGTAFIGRAGRRIRRSNTPPIGSTIAADTPAAAAAAAAQTGAGLLAIVNSLHPAGTQPLSRLARVVNPQAGNYLIPDDLDEIRAALRAGARTWDQIPYYGLRFADRGREWTWSDSCWLVTLARLEQKEVDAQIAWTGHLLGSRGMPQLLLEEHLHALVEELGAARPSERGRYAKLSVAGGGLAKQRRDQISDEDATAIAAAFDRLDVGGPTDAKIGVVLVAAVADEAAGVPRAVESVTAWAADAQRFPRPWVDAVNDTIAAARAAVRSLGS